MQLKCRRDRLAAFSVMMEIDHNGKMKDHEIFESVIRVRERMTYTDVYKILEEDDPELKERYREYLDDFYHMGITLILKRKGRKEVPWTLIS